MDAFRLALRLKAWAYADELYAALDESHHAHQKVTFLYLFTWSKALSSKPFICWCKLFLNSLIAVDFWEILRGLGIFNLLFNSPLTKEYTAG